MRRTFFLFFFLLIVTTIGANPLAKIYQIDDPILLVIESLSIESGVNSHSAAGPISGYELRDQLDRIDTSKLTDASRAVFESTKNNLENPFKRGFWDYSFLISQEIYTNTLSEAPYYTWVEGYNERPPLIYGDVETGIGDHYFGVFSFALQKAFHEEDFQGIGSNNPLFINTNDYAVQNSVPHTAFIGMTNESASLTFGRDTIKFGRGNTGNLMLGEQAAYHDFVLASIRGRTIKYSFLALPMNELISLEILEERFDPEATYLLGQAWYPRYMGDGYWHTLFNGSRSRMYISHRFEFDITPSFRFSLTEGTLFYVDRTDLRMFSPLMFLHDLQNFGEVNNSMGLEIEWTFTPGWFVDFQLFLDQYQTKGESSASGEIPPNAYAGLLGIRNETSRSEWRISSFFETVYTSPFAYLRAGADTGNYSFEDEDYANQEYNLDFVHAVSMEDGRSGVSWLGYTYGPDSIVVATKVNFSHQNNFNFFGDLRFIVQGERGLLIEDKKQSVVYQQPSLINTLSPSGATPEFTLIVGGGGSMTIPNSFVRIYGRYYMVNRWRDYNHTMDNQMTIGVSLTL